MSYKIIAIYCSVAILILSSCSGTKGVLKEKQEDLLLGSWKMESFHWISTDTTYSRTDVQPGIFLFTKNSYSIQWTPTKNARVPFIIISEPTDIEKIAGFESVVFNAGNYKIEGNKISTTAYIAKVPGFEGGKQFYTYEIIGDKLNLIMYDETYPDGTKPQWSNKWQTKFVMKRVY